MKLLKLSPAVILENMSVARYQKFLDTGEYPDDKWSRTWDMLAWIEAKRKIINL